jgi:hypothetical protein
MLRVRSMVYRNEGGMEEIGKEFGFFEILNGLKFF